MTDIDILEDVLSKLDSIHSDKESKRYLKCKIASNLTLFIIFIRRYIYITKIISTVTNKEMKKIVRNEINSFISRK